MSKVITFSTRFPAYHQKKGLETNFVEKILNGLSDPKQYIEDDYKPARTDRKFHTIRKCKRWKVGDKFSPRIWSDKPYRSKQKIICSDLEIKKIWDIEIWLRNDEIWYNIGWNDRHAVCLNTNIGRDLLKRIAGNDGLNYYDFLCWFKIPLYLSKQAKFEPFSGQIICWNESIKYLTGD